MSSSATGDSPRRTRSSRRRLRAFVTRFFAVVGVLALIAVGGAAATVLSGPRVTDVQVDPAAAVTASGSRLIVTTTQSLAEVDPETVTVSPATPFEVDTSGRSIGVRFLVPLDAETEYTVTIDNVTGLGGGPEATIVETFATPPSEVYLLQRGAADGDTIFRTDLTGEEATPVFSAAHIEDFRVTDEHLVVHTLDGDHNALTMTALDGSDPVALPLPGEGYIADLQTADRGERVGYLFTSANLSEGGEGYESALFTTSLDDPLAAPVQVDLDGSDGRVGQWAFVPDTDSVLLLTFDRALLLTSADGSSTTALGAALAIDGIAFGTAEAVVERAEGLVEIDLVTGEEVPLVVATSESELTGAVLPLPWGGTLRTTYPVDDNGIPTGATTVDVVSDAGLTTEVFSVPASDALLNTCVSPSGQYAAILVAPDLADNPYDTYQLPVPETVHTYVLSLPREDAAQAESVVTLSGFAISWCTKTLAWR